MCRKAFCKKNITSMTIALTLVFASVPAVAMQTVSAEEEKSSGHEALTMVTTSATDYSDFLEALSEKYPEINIELISYKGYNTTEYNEILMKADEVPDIYMSAYASLEDLQPERLIDLSSETFTTEYDASLINNISIDGSVYLLPANVAFMGIYYNKTLFEENGWSVPNSLKELEALIPEILEAGVTLSECTTALTGVMFTWLFNFSSTGFMTTLDGIKWKQDFLKGDAAAAGNLESSVESIQRWIDDGILNVGETASDDSETIDRFKEGNTAFLVTNSAIGFSENEDGTGDEYGLMPILSEDGTNNIIITNVGQYMGLSKKLEKQPEKLEDALKVFEFMSTEEGQESINTRSNAVSALKNRTIPEDSPIYEATEMLGQGRTMELVYNGWDNYAVGVGEDILELIKGEITGEEFLGKMDELQSEVIARGGLPALAEADEDLDKEQTAYLVGAAFASAADTDCALISLGDYHGTGMENKNGVNAGIYADVPMTENVVSVFNPLGWSNTIKTMTLTGKTIKEWAEEGYYVDGDPTPFVYVLVTKNSEELDDDTEYTVACVNESEERAAEGNLTETDIIGQEALTSYISKLKTIDGETVYWGRSNGN